MCALTRVFRDSSLTDLAAETHGVLSVHELHAVGLSDDAIRRLVVRGWLQRLTPPLHLAGRR